MNAIDEVQQRAIKKMTEGSVGTIEQGRVAVRAEEPALAERERKEQARAFREPSRPAAPEPVAAFRQIDTEARKLMAAHPDKYPTIEIARQGAREFHPALKVQETAEELQVAAQHKKTKLQRHAELQEKETKDKLRDGEREVTKGQRARREAVAAFVDSHEDDVQRKVDREELDLESAVTDVIRASLMSAFKAKIKGAKTKTKAASSKTIRISPQEFTDRVIKRMRSGALGHDLMPSIAHTMESLVS